MLDIDLARIARIGPRMVVDRIQYPYQRSMVFPPGFAWIFLRGLPVGDVPRTPGIYGEKLVGHVSDDVIVDLAANLGSLLGYADERGGSLIQDIYPVAADAPNPINSGSSVPFNFHTENAHLVDPPSYVGFYCLRGDPGREAITFVAHIDDVLRYLQLPVLQSLRSPAFVTRAGLSFQRSGTSVQPPLAFPILFEDHGVRQWRFNAHNTATVGGDDAAGFAALTALFDVLRSTRVEFSLEAGDLLILDNRVTAHARSVFAPRFDGCDRWFRRFYIRAFA